MFFVGNLTALYLELPEMKSNRSILFFLSLKEFIGKVEVIQGEINIIKSQLYKILDNVSISNLEEISLTVPVSPTLINSINIKIDSYTNTLGTYKKNYLTLKEDEVKMIEKYKTLMRNDKNITYEEEARKNLQKLYIKKLDIIEKSVVLTENYHKIILYIEEVSFDNLVMMKRMNFGIEKLI
jgi:hypothetical protein